jgi:1,4-dihydroxy-6-naphthoate synthase
MTAKTSPAVPTPSIRLAFSPDSDDIFLFWALLRGRIDLEGLTFRHERADTETLNTRVERGDVDVIAISLARYAAVTDRYMLLPHGASVGRGYGPIVVATRKHPLESLQGLRIGVPGLRTTAYWVLRLLLGQFEPVVIPISPYGRAFQSLRNGEVDAALLIHEGRLTYARERLEIVADLGEAWASLTGGLPLPLGVNVIRRGLGPDQVAKISRVCRRSIAWSLEHREEVMTALLAEETRPEVNLDRATLDRYLAMYANADTLQLPDDARRAVSELFSRAYAAGLTPRPIEPEFAP